MIVIAKNTEESLLQEFRKCYENNIAQRCVYLRFSELCETQEEWLLYLSEALESIVDSDLPQVYICHDRDVFVLLPGWTHKRLQFFLQYLSAALQEDNLKELSSLYEVKIDWPLLKNICTDKFKTFKIVQEKIEKQKLQEEQKEEVKKIIKAIDRDLVASISTRRSEQSEASIMIAEDDALARMLIKNVLSPEFSLHVVETGPDAVTGFVESAPDLLFLDIGLPGMDGLEALEAILALDPEAYIIMFSGKKDKETMLKAMELGAFGFVGKPFTRDRLYQYIQQSPSIQEKQRRNPKHKGTG